MALRVRVVKVDGVTKTKAGGEPPWIEAQLLVVGKGGGRTVIDSVTLPSADTPIKDIAGSGSCTCCWLGGAGHVEAFPSIDSSDDTSGMRVRVQVWRKVRFGKIAVLGVADIDASTARRYGAQTIYKPIDDQGTQPGTKAVGTLDVAIEKGGSYLRRVERVVEQRHGANELRPTARHGATQSNRGMEDAVSTLMVMFPGCDHELIQDVLRQCQGDSNRAAEAITSLTGAHASGGAGGGGSRHSSKGKNVSKVDPPLPLADSASFGSVSKPGAGGKSQRSTSMGSDVSLSMLFSEFSSLGRSTVEEVVACTGGDLMLASDFLDGLMFLLQKFPQHSVPTAIATLDACGGDPQQAARDLAKAELMRKKTNAVLRSFPGFDREIVMDTLEATDYNVTQAILMLSSPDYAPQSKSSTLKEAFPQFDEAAINDVVSACGGDVTRAFATLSTMQGSGAPIASQTDGVHTVEEVYLGPIELGDAFQKVAPAGTPRRRLLVLLDDSGSMMGSNLRRGHDLINRLSPHLGRLPVKIVVFGSRKHVTVWSDWKYECHWARLGNAWQGKSGRTFLWGCLTDFVSIEDPRELHVLLITDGEDTESQPPFKGMKGMVPAVRRLNDLGFDGEVSLVALGNEITDDIGKSYMALVGATGGAGAVLNDWSPDTAEQFIRDFLGTMAVRGQAGGAHRREKLEKYAADVSAGRQEFVPANAVCKVTNISQPQPRPDPALDTPPPPGLSDREAQAIAMLRQVEGSSASMTKDLREIQAEHDARARKQAAIEEEQRRVALEQQQRQAQLLAQQQQQQALIQRQLEAAKQIAEQQRQARMAQVQELQRRQQEQEQALRKQHEEQLVQLRQAEALEKQRQAKMRQEQEHAEAMRLEQQRQAALATAAAEEQARVEAQIRAEQQRQLEQRRVEAEARAEQERQREAELIRQQEQARQEQRRIRDAQEAAVAQRLKEEEEQRRSEAARLEAQAQHQAELMRQARQRELEAAEAERKRLEEEQRALERAAAEMAAQREQIEREAVRQRELAMKEKERVEWERAQRKKFEEAEAVQQRLLIQKRRDALPEPTTDDDVDLNAARDNLAATETQASHVGGADLDRDLEAAFAKTSLRYNVVAETEQQRHASVARRLAQEHEASLSPELRRLLERRRKRL